jgi:hypothetical protein
MHTLGWAEPEFLMTHLDEVRSWELMEEILAHHQDPEYRTTILESCIAKLDRDKKCVPCVLKKFPQEERLKLAASIPDQITNDNITDVISALHPDHHQAFFDLVIDPSTKEKHIDQIKGKYVKILPSLNAAMQFKLANAKQDITREYVDAKTNQNTVIKLLKPEARHAYRTSISIVDVLSAHLDEGILLHRNRVEELRAAVIKAESLEEIQLLVNKQYNLVNYISTPHSMLDSRTYTFLNKAPTKIAISWGYKAMMANCKAIMDNALLNSPDMSTEDTLLQDAHDFADVESHHDYSRAADNFGPF